MSRFAKFANSVLHHKIPEICYAFKTCTILRMSVFRSNLEIYCDMLHLTENNIAESGASIVLKIRNLCNFLVQCKTAMLRAEAIALRELCNVRNGLAHLELSISETIAIIHDICLN